MNNRNDKGPLRSGSFLAGVVLAMCLVAILNQFTPCAVHAQASPREPQVLPVMLNEGDGVRNAGFETWVQGRPLFWKSRPELETGVSSEGADVPEGTHAARCAPGEEWDCLKQRVSIQGALGGKTLKLTAEAKAYDRDPGYCFAILILDNGRRVESAPHPGDGSWQTITVSYTLSADESLKWVDVVLANTPGLRRECLFDNVRLAVE